MLCLNPKCKNVLVVMDAHVTDRLDSGIAGLPGTIFWLVACHGCGAEYRIIQKLATPPTREPIQPNLGPPQ